MIKPKTFQDLPSCFQEQFLWNCDLDYDSYGGSMAETVHSIICNYPYEGSTNDYIIKEAYNDLSVETIESWVKSEIETSKSRIIQMENLLTFELK
jgi:hypothetical protein